MFYKKAILQILQYSLENNCIGVSKPATLLKRDSHTGDFREYCIIFKNTYFEKHLGAAASSINLLYDFGALFWNFGISTSPLLVLHYGDKIHKIRTSFKILVSNKATLWRLKESQSNDKLLSKMSSSYHME